MSEEETLPAPGIMAIGGGIMLLVIWAFSQLGLFLNMFALPVSQAAINLNQELGFVTFILGNCFIAYGGLTVVLEKITPKTPKWNAKEEVRKYLEKPNGS